LNALRELEEKRNLVYLLVILPDKIFAVAGQVFGEGVGSMPAWAPPKSTCPFA
jgi:hypothetical protein